MNVNEEVLVSREAGLGGSLREPPAPIATRLRDGRRPPIVLCHARWVGRVRDARQSGAVPLHGPQILLTAALTPDEQQRRTIGRPRRGECDAAIRRNGELPEARSVGMHDVDLRAGRVLVVERDHLTVRRP